MDYRQSGGELDFQKKQRMLSEEIRKTNRAQIFGRKRKEGKTKCTVLDKRFLEDIERFHKIQPNCDPLSIGSLIEKGRSLDVIEKHYGLIGIRKFIQTQQQRRDDEEVKPILIRQILQVLVESINLTQFPQLQFEAIYAVLHMIELENCSDKIVEESWHQSMIGLIKNEHRQIVEVCLYCIGNMSGGSAFIRDKLIKSGALHTIVYKLEIIKKHDLVIQSLWVISNLCRGFPLPIYEHVREGVSLLIKAIIYNQAKDDQVLLDSLWAISYHIEPQKQSSTDRMALFSQLVTIINKSGIGMAPSLQILNRLIQTASVQESRIYFAQSLFIQTIQRLLEHEQRSATKRVCSILCHFSDKINAQQITSLLQRQPMLSRLLQLLKGEDDGIKVRAVQFLQEIGRRGDQEVIERCYYENNVIECMVSNLSSCNKALVVSCLQNIYVLLELGRQKGKGNPFMLKFMNIGGTSLLQRLQHTKHKQVYEMVIKIIQDYFEVCDL